MGYKVTKADAPAATPGGEDKDQQGFQTFEDLSVYQAAREFRKAVYAVTRDLPEVEKYGLASQMRRAAVSLTNNIAEGHGRYHYPDQIRFMLQSRGSLEELIDDLNVCLDEGYLQPAPVAELKQKAQSVLALLNGYLRYLRKRSGTVREETGVDPDDDGFSDGLPM
jgi:four helix bundle protein